MLVGRVYWAGLLDWMRDTMLESGAIAPSDLELFHVTDEADEVVD